MAQTRLPMTMENLLTGKEQTKLDGYKTWRLTAAGIQMYLLIPLRLR